MIISARPYPDIKALTSKNNLSNMHDFHFFPLGRDALLSGLIALGLQKDDSIIVPAYMCNSAIKPLQSYGFKIIFIDIDDNLRMPVDKIRKMIKNDNSIMALLTVHYYGLTQDIGQLVGVCRRYGIKIVEDASHSFMSQFLRDNTCIKGDIEIFSMRKTLPIVDGGALRINNNSEHTINNNNHSNSIISDSKYLILCFLKKVLIKVGVNIYGQFINNIKVKLRRKKNHYDNHNPNLKSCQASRQLKKYLGNADYLKDSQRKIVNNFNKLGKSLQSIGFRVFLESVSDNVVPQAFVLYDDNGGLVDYLRSKGVGAWQWPDIEVPKEVSSNPELYPNSMFFDKSLILLPIHQDISEKHLLYMLKILESWILCSRKD